MDIELTRENSIEFLSRFVALGQSKGCYSIKEAAFLYKAVSDFKSKQNFEAVVRAIVVANSKGAYSLEDAALVEKILDFVEKEKLFVSEDILQEV